MRGPWERSDRAEPGLLGVKPLAVTTEPTETQADRTCAMEPIAAVFLNRYVVNMSAVTYGDYNAPPCNPKRYTLSTDLESEGVFATDFDLSGRFRILLCHYLTFLKTSSTSGALARQVNCREATLAFGFVANAARTLNSRTSSHSRRGKRNRAFGSVSALRIS